MKEETQTFLCGLVVGAAIGFAASLWLAIYYRENEPIKVKINGKVYEVLYKKIDAEHIYVPMGNNGK